MRHKLSFLLCLVVLAPASLASASPLFELAGDLAGQGGLQGREASTGASAAYFNPALLTDAEPGLSAGVVVIRNEIGIRIDGRPGTEYDVPAGVADAAHADSSRFDLYPVDTASLQAGRPAGQFSSALPARPRQHAGTGHQAYTYESIGLVLKLFEDDLTLGFTGLIPNSGFTQLTSFYNDEREQYFSNSLHPELYADRMKALSFAFAGGYRVASWLSVGVGTTLSLQADILAPAFVADGSRLYDIQLDTNAGIDVSLAPHGGISLKPSERWHITATVHAPQKVELNAKFKFLLATGTEDGSTLKFLHDYMPWRTGVGSTYDFWKSGALRWSASGSLLYERWSQYIDRHANRPAGAYTWKDTLSAVGGLRFTSTAFSLATDVQYKPSPVPLQTGRTNYVDNDRVGLSVSGQYTFKLRSTRLRLGVQLQAYRLLYRHQTKLPTPTNPEGQNRTPQLVADEVADDAVLAGEPLPGAAGLQTNNPGWPGFSSVGWVASGGLTLTVML